MRTHHTIIVSLRFDIPSQPLPEFRNGTCFSPDLAENAVPVRRSTRAAQPTTIMMKASLILLYFAIMLLCSCSQPASPGPIRQTETSGAMLPLHTGNTRTHVETGSGRHGIPADPHVIASGMNR
ncbi:MAG: hypothetical protein JST22_02445 [Bacteroidetes bacterium]|nr:hypothetical protein [Bacteroidota bacterium]